MQFYSKRFPGPSMTLFPLGDWHYGSPQFHGPFVAKVIDEIKHTPNAYWVGLGDFLENAIVGSKSDLYTQTVAPKEQMEHIVELLKPIADKGLFLISGNHECRTMRLVGLQPEQYIGIQLGLPFMGFSCLAVFLLSKCRDPYGFSAFFHHNSGGSSSTSGKVSKIETMRKIVPTADAIFAGHHHITSRLPVTWFEAGRTQINTKTGYNYCIGSALTWNESYAEEKMMPPATVEHIKVTFKGGTNGSKTDDRQQVYEVITP